MREAEQYLPIRNKKVHPLIVLAYLILGLYFINYPFRFVEIPELVSSVEQWIIFAGGILMLFGAINYFRAKHK
jgi:predicted membrane channel-forming protein YqfA (hemolysin III family)